MNANKIVLISGLVVAATLTVPSQVNAQNNSSTISCSISSQGVNFGSYNVFDINPKDGTGLLVLIATILGMATR